MRIILIDAMNLVYRAQYSHGALATADKKPTGCIYGFLNMMQTIYNKFETSPLVFLWEGGYLRVVKDGKKFEVEPHIPTWRKSLPRQEYKANRTITQDKLDAHAQVPEIQKVLAYLRHPQYSVPGAEGDDLIGIAANKLVNKLRPDEVCIVSGDRDFLQLVSDHNNIRVYRPTKDGLKRYKESNVMEEYGVLPYQFAAYKSFVGDGTDHYKGIPGVGPKAAVDLITAGADPSLPWQEQKDNVQRDFLKLQPSWRKATDCYKLALIPRTYKHKYFPEELRIAVRNEMEDMHLKLKRKFTKDELKASIDLFARFCAKWEMPSILAYKRKYFSGAIVDGVVLQ